MQFEHILMKIRDSRISFLNLEKYFLLFYQFCGLLDFLGIILHNTDAAAAILIEGDTTTNIPNERDAKLGHNRPV